MIVPLLVVGSLGTPVTGLLIQPDVHGARHGLQMFNDLGRFGWYGYLAVSVALLVTALVGTARGTQPGRRRAAGAASVLLTLTVLLGAIHVLVVAKGMNFGDGKPLLAAVAAVVGVAAALALAAARARLRRTD